MLASFQLSPVRHAQLFRLGIWLLEIGYGLGRCQLALPVQAAQVPRQRTELQEAPRQAHPVAS